MPEENPCESAAASPVLDVTSLTEKPWRDTPARKAQQQEMIRAKLQPPNESE